MENLTENNQKPSKIKALLVIGGLIVVVAGSVPIMKYLSSHLVDEKKMATEIVKYQKSTHEAFKGNDIAVAQVIFSAFPEAKTALIGNVGLGDDGYSVYVRPTALDINDSSQIDSAKLLSEKQYGVYCVTGKLTNGIIASANIVAYKKESSINPFNDAGYTFNMMSTDVTPYKIIRRADVNQTRH